MLNHLVVRKLFVTAAMLFAAHELQAQRRMQVQSPEEALPQLRFAGDAVRIPMPQLGGRSIVQVMVGEHGPYKFFIDTGAGISVIDSEIASAIGLEVVGGQAVGAPGGSTVDADRVKIPSMVMGDLVIDGVTALALDLVTMTGGIMEGILGMDLFGEVLLTLDPSGAQAIVARGELEGSGSGVIAVDRSRGRLQFPIDVAGQSVTAQIDHGSPSGLTLGIDLMESVPNLNSPGGERTVGMVGGTRTISLRTLDGVLRFAGLEYENPRVSFMDPSPGTANIGSEILNELVTTLDIGNSRIAFQLVGGAAPAVRPSTHEGPRRLGVQFRGMGGSSFSEIVMVESGSLGEQSGFRAGDIPIRLNGKAMSEYDQGSLGSLIRGAEVLRWEIERDGVRMVIEIP